MSLRVIIDQGHEEFLTIAKTEIFQTLLAEMQFIIFPLIDRPITLEKIKDDHVLILGCPAISFENSEITAIIQFVEKGNYLLMISGSGGDFANNSNLSEIGRRFEFEFNPDYVEDVKHHLNFTRIPIIHKIKKSPITKHIKRLVYSGCSISILDPSTVPLLLTDSDSIPQNSPVMVISENHRVFGIGGYSFFTDDPAFGIKAKDNVRLVYNLFEYIKSHFGKVKVEIEKTPSVTPKKINLKIAKKDFIKLLSTSIEKMNKIAEEIDANWEECSQLTRKRQYKETKRLISTNYQQTLQKIETLAKDIGEYFSFYNDMFPKFRESIQTNFNEWYEIEAEIRAKLDMIRNNLQTKLKQEQPQQ